MQAQMCDGSLVCHSIANSIQQPSVACHLPLLRFPVSPCCLVPPFSAQTGDAAGAEALLQSALQHWQSRSSAAPRDAAASAGLGWCLQRLVALKLSQGAAADAMALYQQLSKLGGAGSTTSAAAMAQLARAAAVSGDAAAVAALQKQLPGEAQLKGLSSMLQATRMV
jgi:hypothetical protein